ncbi:MAG TPA: 2-dehydropantoate 2-reductase [Candidatus Eremiobacteraceae bacterium]|nr:2-dehydropantoate 2-reductase [Candidatus Eremiobacteraceae bacterium]
MTNSEAWPRVAVVGAGAVGGYFGGMLARAGAPVAMIGRPAFVAEVEKNGLFIDSFRFQERVKVEVSSEIAAVHGADVVLFCVKTLDTAATAKEVKPYLSRECIVVSLQNGVDNIAQIREAAGIEAIPSVVYVAAAMPEPGHIKHAGRGDLVIGPPGEKVERVAKLMSRGDVPSKISDNIEGELWTKFLWNCASNALTALGHISYSELAADPDARKLYENTVLEALAVARAAGVRIPAADDPQALMAKSLHTASQLGDARSSTAQDMARGKRTEIHSLNGYVVRRGLELGVPTPVNHALFALVKLSEGK